MPYVWSGYKKTAARFLIDNAEGIDVEVFAKLANASIINPEEANVLIDKQLSVFVSALPTNCSPLVIYLGNGASQLIGALEALQSLPSLQVGAKRHWEPGQKPLCFVEPFTISNDVTHCLLVDDVISSGGTMCAVAEQLPSLAECWAVAQVSQRLGEGRRRTLSRFARVIVGAEVAGEAVSYVPINSVSTLVANRDLAINYALRNVPEENRTAFLACL